jgi:hypothetical protein
MDATFGSDCNFRMGYLTKQSAAWAVLVRVSCCLFVCLNTSSFLVPSHCAAPHGLPHKAWAVLARDLCCLFVGLKTCSFLVLPHCAAAPHGLPH